MSPQHEARLEFGLALTVYIIHLIFQLETQVSFL